MSVNKNPVNKAKAEIYLEIENITVGKEKLMLTETMPRARESEELSRLFIHSQLLTSSSPERSPFASLPFD